MEYKDEYKPEFNPSWDKPVVKEPEVKPEIKPVAAKPVVKEVKKEETVVDMLLRVLRGHGHIFNTYEIKVLEKDAGAKKVIDTYTDVKASRKLHVEKK